MKTLLQDGLQGSMFNFTMRRLANGSARWLGSVACLCLCCRLSSAQDSIEFTGFGRQANGEAWLQLTTPAGGYYRIDTSTNLTDWQALLTRQSAGVDQHLDSAAPYVEQRFYRAEALSGANPLTGDHLATTNGDVVIHPLFHATFVMRWNGMMIYVDPDNGISYAGMAPADLVLVTHSHGDHFDADTIAAVRNASAPIVAPQAVYNGLSTSLRGFTTVLANGATASMMGIQIEAVPAYNAYHPQGQGNGYVLTLGGRRMYISGDTGDTPAMRALSEIDLAFVCMNVPYTLTVVDAASVVRSFQPRMVYPYHFRNQDSSYADLNDFKQRVGQDLGIEVRLRDWYD